MVSLIGIVSGLLVFVFSSIYQMTFYFCAISIVALLIYIIVASIRKCLPGGLVSSFVIAITAMTLLILWAKLTSGVESYRETYLRSPRRAGNYIVINRMNENLDTHEIFHGAKSVEKVFQRDSNAYIDEFEYVFGLSCRKNIEDAAKTIFLSRDTTRIHSPWHGYKVFCDEFLGSNFIRLTGQDTLAIYSNAIISTKITSKKFIKISLIHMGDIMYAVVDTSKNIRQGSIINEQEQENSIEQ